HETNRFFVDSIVDERTLREIYLPAFEMVVKQADPWSVMASYNKINGTYASENRWLLTDLLKKEWKYRGFVVSDWGAT
ncbi:glycoside hydrolase family 3 protein, partial [Acinetobacter johnsonii]